MIVTSEPAVPPDLAACFRRVEPLSEVKVAISESRGLAVYLWHAEAFDQELADEQLAFGIGTRHRSMDVAQQPTWWRLKR